MRWLRKISLRFRSLFRKKAVDRELDEELRFHIERQVSENIAAGMSPAAARRAAALEFGASESFKEDCRDSREVNLIQGFFHDIRFSFRMLRKNPGFTAMAVLTLALGIGASTAIFSAVNPILFESLPYPHPGRILTISGLDNNGTRGPVAFHTYREVSARNRSLNVIAVMKLWHPTLAGTGEPELLDGEFVSSGYFSVLGVSPAIGRDFLPADDQFHGPKVVIIGDRLWRRRFGGDRAIVGRQVTLDDDSYTVIGVMPSTFESVLTSSAELWRPLQYDAGNAATFLTREWGNHLRMVARLRAEFTLDQARQDLDTIVKTPVPDFPRPRWVRANFAVSSLQDDITRGVKPALLAIISAVLLVLLIACVNVTNLLLARGAQRRGEFALRSALGAERGRLIRQMLTESLLLAVMGGVVGMAAAVLGVRALVALSPPALPRVGAIAVNGLVFAFGLGITTLIGLAFGLVPALHAARNDPQKDLGQGSRRTVGGHQRIRSGLVVAECALSLVLLVSAGLLLRSLELLFAIAPGFDASRLLVMQVHLTSHYFRDADRIRFFNRALEAVRNVPGVTEAAITSQLPLSGDNDIFGAVLEKDHNPNTNYAAFRYGVSPGYFETMRIPLRRGRLFDAHDVFPVDVRPVLINESLAKSAFPGQDPLGQRLRIGGAPDRPWDVVVGVVGDVKQASLSVAQSDAVYVSYPQWLWADSSQWLVVRARGDVAALAPSIQKAIWSVDKDQPIVHVGMMDDLLAKSEAERRFALVLFESFALAALVLAAAGIYGVLSGSVAERTREIGIRVALGASRGGILALVMRQGMMLTALGGAIGLVGAAAASRALITLLFGISPLDLTTYLGVIALMAFVSAAACWVPAWRAARVDPAITLRAE